MIIVLYLQLDVLRSLGSRGLAVGPLWHRGLKFGRDFERRVTLYTVSVSVNELSLILCCGSNLT